MTKVVAGCFETESEGRRHLERVENIRVISLDVRSEASVGAAVEAVTRLAGSEGLTALVNNAAVLVFGETMWQTEEQVRAEGTPARMALMTSFSGPISGGG